MSRGLAHFYAGELVDGYIRQEERLLCTMAHNAAAKGGEKYSLPCKTTSGIISLLFAGEILDGLVSSIGKVRGRRAALEWIAKRVAQVAPDTTLPIAFGHSNAPQAMAECMSVLEGQTKGAPRYVKCDISAVVGTHVGPGATGLAYFTAP